MSWFKRRPTRAELTDQLAERLVAGLKSPVPEWLTEGAEQPLEHVHAEWIALQRWILDYSIQTTLVSYDKVRPLWERIETKTRAYLLTQQYYPHFQDIADARSKEYGDWFNFGLSQCNSVQPLLDFSVFVATRILKPEQSLKVGLGTFEQQLRGANMCNDIATVAALSSYITDNMTINAKFLKNIEKQVPRAFEGPMQ